MQELKMMIVDDEETIRLGFTQLIRRLLPEWEVVASCPDASSALAAAAALQPNLAVIDINMPGMSGLELSKELELRYPQMNKIILTGYEKFSLVQAALRYGVADYLLKPVQRDELVQAVRRIEAHIREQESQAALQLEKLLLEWFVSQSSDRMKELEHAFAAKGWVGIRQGKPLEYAVIVLFWEDGHSGIDRLHIGLVAGHLETAAPGVEQVIGIVAAQSCTLFVVLGTELPSQEGWRKRMQRLGLVRSGAGAYHQGPRLHAFGCSGPLSELNRLQEGYQSALNHMLHDGDGDFAEQGEEDRERIKSLAVALETNDAEGAVQLLRQWKDDIVRMSWVNSSRITARCFLFLAYLTSQTSSAGQSRLGSELRDAASSLAQRLPTALTPPVMVKAIEEFVGGLALEGQEQGNRKVITRVQELIREQFANPDLNLEMLAQRVFLHPTYLSELFKETTGQKFIDYVTTVRMEEAKRILRETDMKMYEVALAVGYTSPKYFSTLFRKIYQLTPMMYREKSQ